MSAHAPTTTAPARGKALTALTVSAAGIWLALATAVPAAAGDQPEPTAPAQTAGTVQVPGPPNYPNYDPRYEVPRDGSVIRQGGGLEPTSIALGALGGIALAGAGLGITLGVQRRRDHAAAHTA